MVSVILRIVAIAVAAAIAGSVIVCVKNYISEVQMDEFMSWVMIAVEAAEQIYPAPESGELKKQYVTDWLKQQGIEIDESLLNTMIESAVYELNNEKTYNWTAIDLEESVSEAPAESE